MYIVYPHPALTLGDDVDDEATARQPELTETVHRVGDIKKRAQSLEFFKNKQYLKVGGQQLKAQCMGCLISVSSTGSTQLVDHCIGCVGLRGSVREGFKALRSRTQDKRVEKRELHVVAKEEVEIAARDHA